jgi:hypothetical protein
MSEYFDCENGVRQVENLSLFFSHYFEMTHTFLESKNITGLQTISDEIESNLDDSALLAETASEAFEKPFSPYLIKGLFEIYKGTK